MSIQNSSSISVIRNDGTAVPFDVEDIQTRIIRACITAGETESWIAGDLSLSIEFALISSRRTSIRSDELDSMVVRALEDSGYPQIAADYQRISGTPSPDLIEVSRTALMPAISKNLAMEGDRLEQIAAQVENALKTIGFRQTTLQLILEMARQFRDNEPAPASQKSGAHTPVRKRACGSAIVLRQPDLVPMLPPETARMLELRILRVFNISRLFPVLRIELSLSAFSDFCALPKPVMELAFWSVSRKLSGAVDSVCLAADRFCSAHGETGAVPLPLYLGVRDSLRFGVDYMGCQKTIARECVSGLVGTFASSLGRQPFKTTL